MARLLIQFFTDELAEFRWAVIDEAQQTADINWQLAGDNELATVAAQNPHPVILIIPQQCVYMTHIVLPQRAGRQLLSAIEYQIEEQLAQDVESQHCALGDVNANPISIAVVERTIMMRCMALAHAHGLRLINIYPELFLCPWSGSGVALMLGHDGYLLRYGDYRGLKCSEQTLAAMLEMIGRDVEFDSIDCYLAESEALPQLDGLELEHKALSAVRPGFLGAPVIDLQQRDYQLSSPWRGLAKTWKWAALLLASLLLVGAYNKAVALHGMEQDLAAIKQQQYELLKPHLGADMGPNDNLKKVLIDRLKQLQSNQNEQEFLQLLLEFTRAREQFPEVNITRIGYQGKELIFDISSTQLNKIETLLEVVQKQGVDANLVSLNIKPELSSGRLVMRGGDDV
ncbi:MAG: type II secretion system protein GspL [Gammaproteobacteria bacterium]|jgi:general secretion pathway protein L|nr:type II secretion system protein GspL [Gammaproteobacteria bacterium]